MRRAISKFKMQSTEAQEFSLAGYFMLCYLFISTGSALCSPGWPPTLDRPASASQVLGLQVCTTMLGSGTLFIFYFGTRG
jgi:hypothetical protein